MQATLAVLQRLLVELIAAEGFCVCCGSVAVVVVAMRAVLARRAALFGLFLAVPNAALKALASRSTNNGDEDEGSEDGALFCWRQSLGCSS